MTERKDAALRAVARVRGVRERDSRIGMVTAIAEEQAAAARVERLEEALTTTPEHTVGDLASFTAHQYRLDSIGSAIVAARSAQQSAAVLAVTARDHWSADRTRLAAVEALIERREAARRAERLRRENREMDAIAEELWRRANDGEDTP
jgi:flagellar export protein FliJ